MGGFIVPPMPAELVAALKRQQGAVPAAPMGAGLPVNGRPPMASPIIAQPPTGQPLPGTGTNLGPTGANVMPATPGKVPPVTDDPSVPKGPAASSSTTGTTDDLETRGMISRLSPPSAAAPPLPQTPNLSSYLDPALKQYHSDLSGYQQADQANRIDPQQVKPRLWERLAGFGLGMTQLKDPQNAGAVASEVVNRRRTGAEQARSTALAPWTQRLEQDKAGVPLAEAAERTAHEQGQLDVERFNALTNSDYKDAIAAMREEVAKGNIEKAQDLLDQQQKALDEKTKHDAEWYQMQHALLDVRQQLADARDRQVDKGNKAKPSQSVAIESKKAAALAKAKTAYDRETELAGSDPEARKTADDNFKQAQQDAQDAYEAEINAAGGDATHQDVESWRGKPATPPAATAAPAAGTKPAAQSDNGVPTAMGPKGESPTKTASDGKVKIGYYKSTGQWMLVPQSQGAK